MSSTLNPPPSRDDSPLANPYQAPTALEPELAPDTEFLISDELVLGQGTIRLPALCIATALKHDLLAQVRRYSTPPPWVHQLRFLVVLLTCIAIPLIFGIEIATSRRLTIGLGISPTMLVLAAGIAALIGLTVLGFLLRDHVVIEWSVRQPLHAERRRKRRIIRVLELLIFLGTWMGIQTGVASEDLLVPVTLGLLLILTLLLRTPGYQIPAPRLLGKSGHLFVVSGLSPDFLAAVRQMIARYQASGSLQAGKKE